MPNFPLSGCSNSAPPAILVDQEQVGDFTPFLFIVYALELTGFGCWSNPLKLDFIQAIAILYRIAIVTVIYVIQS